MIFLLNVLLVCINVDCFSAAEKLLCRAPFLVDETKQGSVSALHVAAGAGHVDVAAMLIKASVKCHSSSF